MTDRTPTLAQQLRAYVNYFRDGAPTKTPGLLWQAADRLEAADKVIEAARVALAEVAADNDSEYGCSHADAAQQALDLIAGWKGPAATAGEMNPPASKAGLELAEPGRPTGRLL